MIKILFDFVPSDTPCNSPYYNLDTECRDMVDYYVYDQYHFKDIFDYHYKIDTGTCEEKNLQLHTILTNIEQTYHGEIIYMQFLGHGVKNLSGLQFVRYEDLCSWLLPIKNHNVILLNMMSSCYTVGMTQHRICYNTLWFCNNEVQDYCASFDFAKFFLREDGTADFETFLKKPREEKFGEDKT